MGLGINKRIMIEGEGGLPARPSMDQTLKKQMTQTMMLAGDFLTASKKCAWRKNSE